MTNNQILKKLSQDVINIVVLLILAGVSISILVGENGVANNAKK